MVYIVVRFVRVATKHESVEGSDLSFIHLTTIAIVHYIANVVFVSVTSVAVVPVVVMVLRFYEILENCKSRRESFLKMRINI